MVLIDPRKAAAHLGVSERRVRALARSGRVRAQKIGGRWLIDQSAVARRRALGRSPGRPVSSETAWAILFRASGAEPSWLPDSARGRLRRRLRVRSLAREVVRLRLRAEVRYFLGTEAAQDVLRQHPHAVASGVSAANVFGADVRAPSVVDAYVPAGEAQRFADGFALHEVEEPRANIILRATAFWPFDGQRVAPRAVVAADLADSLDERTRRAGLRLLRVRKEAPRVSADERTDLDREWDGLTSALTRYGVLHLPPGREVADALPTPRALFTRLANAPQPRLRQAVVFLLLTRPELAHAAVAAVRTLSDGARDLAMRRYVAAAALQRMARMRIEERLGPQPLLPPEFLSALALPSLDDDHGEHTLWELSRQEEARYGYDAWGTYRRILELFLAESRRREWGQRR